ncbi:MAG: PAS domain-containing protein [bacterium]|nr:PAS domain-containing protein [bacterium]
MTVYVEKLLEIIKINRWKIHDFAKEIGISRSTIYSWKENKRTPPDSLIRRIADFLNINVSEISDLKNITKDTTLKDASEVFNIYGSKSEIDKNIAINNKIIESLQNSNNKLSEINIIIKALFTSIESLIYVKDNSLNYLIANNKFKENLGLKKHFIISGMNDYQLFSKNEADEIILKDKEVIRTLKYQVNYKCKIPGSRYKKSAYESRYPILDRQNNFLGIIGTYHDTTELDRQTSIAEKRGVLIEIGEDGFWSGRYDNNEGCIIYDDINKAVAQIFDVSYDSIKINSKSLQQRMSENTIKMLRAWLSKSKKIKHGKIGYKEYQIICSKNQIKWIRDTRSKKGETYFGTITDITKEKFLEIEQKRQNKLNEIHKRINDNKNYVMWYGKLERKSGIIKHEYVNNALESIYGISKEEFLSDITVTLRDQIYKEDHDLANNFIDESKKTDQPCKCVYRIEHKITGEIKWILDTRHKVGDIFSGEIFDITENSKFRNPELVL